MPEGTNQGGGDEGLLAKLEAYARSASIVLGNLAGGGSENFTRIGEQHYADPEICLRRIQQRAETRERLTLARPSPQPSDPELQREYLLLASYCGTDNEHCTERRPCSDCLGMCNVFDSDGAFVRELGPIAALSIDGGGSIETDIGEQT